MATGTPIFYGWVKIHEILDTIKEFFDKYDGDILSNPLLNLYIVLDTLASTKLRYAQRCPVTKKIYTVHVNIANLAELKRYVNAVCQSGVVALADFKCMTQN